MKNKIKIKLASTATDFSNAKELILEYVAWLGIDLSFQNFEKEMEGLPQMYSPSEGGLFIAYKDGDAVGIAGLRKFSELDGELKRMYVKPNSRGLGLGALLLTACLDAAKKLKYQTVKLDTADFMKSAIKIYTDNGFVEIPAYRHNPHESARYYELSLKK
ncbi:GNAT family N-acetyltransferase [Arenibacter sp. F20364]|uniref:GNAT family N-acetyltransferase n=1 Tax=Arenibacter sp. F20364 TaxID=2926415 RepID=UPI001FF13F9C|nr:GNAT family N-acetyltransferase [Arenibacter sp. F20364]MCK0189858.1 GNAT family N-acetyltransferase [Arenibacter sp. F20364]